MSLPSFPPCPFYFLNISWRGGLEDCEGTRLIKGNRWEFNVVESKKELWRIQSLVPPPMGSEAYALWTKEDRATPWKAEA